MRFPEANGDYLDRFHALLGGNLDDGHASLAVWLFSDEEEDYEFDLEWWMDHFRKLGDKRTPRPPRRPFGQFVPAFAGIARLAMTEDENTTTTTAAC